MDTIKSLRLFVFIALIICGCATDVKEKPIGVQFQKETLRRLGKHGDNWCITWASDDSQVASMCDGNWLGSPEVYYHNHLYRITGSAEGFEREDIKSYPDFSGDAGSWFGYGIVSVDGNIFSAASKTPGTQWSGPFRGVKLLKSSDNGASWLRVGKGGDERFLEPKDSMRNLVNDAEMFFLEESGVMHEQKEAFPFSYFDFVQNGKDNSAAKDEFVYIYSPEGAHAHKLTMARVEKGVVGVRDEWQYFVGYDEDRNPLWSDDLKERAYVHEFPTRSAKGHFFGWYSWLPSVVWNEGLGLYIMVNGGTYAGHGLTNSDEDYYDAWMHTETGSLGFWYAEKPYGPWREFYYTDYWVVDDDKNRTYQPKLSPKWMSEDGKEMTLIWSDAMENEEGDSHTVNYLWNQMKITIVID